MTLLTHIRQVVLETLLSPEFREWVEGYSEAELREHVQKHVFAPANPSDYDFSTVVCATHHPIPEDNNFEFWSAASDRARTDEYDAWFEPLCAGQVGVVHEVKREKSLAGIVTASSQEHHDSLDMTIQVALERYDVHSPIEQVFYASWEFVRERLWRNRGDPNYRRLWRFQLRPQYVLYREQKDRPEGYGKAYDEWAEHRRRGPVYRADFAVVELDTQAFFDSPEHMNPIARDGDMYKLHKVAIECDSFQFHAKNLSNQDFAAMKKRERFFTSQGWQVFSFTGSEIRNSPLACVNEVHQHLLAAAGRPHERLRYSGIYGEPNTAPIRPGRPQNS